MKKLLPYSLCYSYPLPLANDVEAINVVTPVVNCTGTFTPIVTFKNRGTNTINSCTVTYQIDAKDKKLIEMRILNFICYS